MPALYPQIEQKCCGKDCTNRGVNDPEFDFYMCAACGGELEFWLNYYAEQDRRVNN